MEGLCTLEVIRGQPNCHFKHCACLPISSPSEGTAAVEVPPPLCFTFSCSSPSVTPSFLPGDGEMRRLLSKRQLLCPPIFQSLAPSLLNHTRTWMSHTQANIHTHIYFLPQVLMNACRHTHTNTHKHKYAQRRKHTNAARERENARQANNIELPTSLRALISARCTPLLG